MKIINSIEFPNAAVKFPTYHQELQNAYVFLRDVNLPSDSVFKSIFRDAYFCLTDSVWNFSIIPNKLFMSARIDFGHSLMVIQSINNEDTKTGVNSDEH